MSFLTMIQAAAPRCNITKPSSVIGTSDRELIAFIELAQEEGEELSTRCHWQRLVTEATFTSTAVESQGNVATIIGSDFDYILNDTVWNRTLNRRMWPITEVDWQSLQSNNIAGPDSFFRIRGNLFIVFPTMTAGETVALEYISKNWCESSGGTGQALWAADADVGRLDERIMSQGIVWRWKRRFGKPDWESDREKYEKRVLDEMARDGAKKRLNLNARPGRVADLLMSNRAVREGTWSL